MKDELNEPLGLGRPLRSQSPAPERGGVWRIAALILLLAAGAGGYALVQSDPYAGEPHAIARIEPAAPPEPAPAARVAAAEAVPPAVPPAAGEDSGLASSEMERLSGVKVTRSGGGEGSSARIIHIERPPTIGLPPAPDRRVVERGPHGLLPRLGADGARPMDVYARPFVVAAALPRTAPKIALVIGGVGLNAQATQAAIDDLPEAVTLAFAPYGPNVESAAARARQRGHETLLQAPMETFDYPQNNPGPHTLRVGAREETLDDLSWLMSRFPGYAGVMNHLGGRFTADEASLGAALAEIAGRGLYYLDDGASPRSLAATLAPKLSLPFARVDVSLDARAAPQTTDAALAQLEALARRNGAAVGFADALPANIARLARFARDLERRGVALAPLSAALRAADASAEAGAAPRP